MAALALAISAAAPFMVAGSAALHLVSGLALVDLATADLDLTAGLLEVDLDLTVVSVALTAALLEVVDLAAAGLSDHVVSEAEALVASIVVLEVVDLEAVGSTVDFLEAGFQAVALADADFDASSQV